MKSYFILNCKRFFIQFSCPIFSALQIKTPSSRWVSSLPITPSALKLDMVSRKFLHFRKNKRFVIKNFPTEIWSANQPLAPFICQCNKKSNKKNSYLRGVNEAHERTLSPLDLIALILTIIRKIHFNFPQF